MSQKDSLAITTVSALFSGLTSIKEIIMQKSNDRIIDAKLFEGRAGVLYIYWLYPIDSWPGWLDESEYKARLATCYLSEPEAAEAWIRYEILRDDGFKFARTLGWQGDIREGPFIAGLPGASSDGQVMIAWKQPHSGDTFVVSPYPLTWLV